MSTYLRKLWKIKPPMWGPPKVVQGAVRDYFERHGAAAPHIYMPMLAGAGNTAVNYGQSTANGVFDSVDTPEWDSRSVLCEQTFLSLPFANESIFTVLVRADVRTFNKHLVGMQASGDNTTGWRIHVQDNQTYRVRVNEDNIDKTVPYYLDKNFHDFGFTINGSDLLLFFDGVPLGGGSVTLTDIVSTLYVGQGGYSTVAGPKSFFDAVTVFNGVAVQSSVFELLHDNPYGAIQPRYPTVYFDQVATPATFNPAWAMKCNNLLSGGLNV